AFVHWERFGHHSSRRGGWRARACTVRSNRPGHLGPARRRECAPWRLGTALRRRRAERRGFTIRIVEIRPFRPADVERILEIERASFGRDAWPRSMFLGFARHC